MTSNDLAIWQQLAATNQKYLELADTLFKTTDDRVGLIRRGHIEEALESRLQNADNLDFLMAIGLLKSLEPTLAL